MKEEDMNAFKGFIIGCLLGAGLWFLLFVLTELILS